MSALFPKQYSQADPRFQVKWLQLHTWASQRLLLLLPSRKPWPLSCFNILRPHFRFKECTQMGAASDSTCPDTVQPWTPQPPGEELSSERLSFLSSVASWTPQHELTSQQSCKSACLFFFHCCLRMGRKEGWAAATLREQGLPAPTEADPPSPCAKCHLCSIASLPFNKLIVELNPGCTPPAPWTLIDKLISPPPPLLPPPASSYPNHVLSG